MAASPFREPYDALDRRRDSITSEVSLRSSGRYSHISFASEDGDREPLMINADIPDTPSKNLSVTSAATALANCAIGAGVLSFPAALKDSGVTLGLLLIAVVTVICGAGLGVLGYAWKDGSRRRASHLSLVSYETICQTYIGEWARRVCEVAILLYCTGLLIGYFIVIGDAFGGNSETEGLLTEWAGSHWYTDRRIAIAFFAVFVIFPLVMQKSLKFLAPFSIVAVACILFTVGLVLYDGSARIHKNHGVTPDVDLGAKFTYDLFSALPVFCFAFQCNTIMIPVCHELHNPTMKRIWITIALAMLICFGSYALVSTLAYVAFGKETAPDVLLNFDPKSTPSVIARALFVLHIAFASYPINAFAAKLGFASLLQLNPDSRAMKLVVIGYYVVCLTVSLVVSDVKIAFQITGSVAASTLMMILPPVLWLHVLHKSSPWRYAAMFLTFLGLAFFVSTATTTIIQIAKGG